VGVDSGHYQKFGRGGEAYVPNYYFERLACAFE